MSSWAPRLAIPSAVSWCCAEQQQGGKAIMAKVQVDSDGKANYDVDVVTNGHFHIAMVDTSTGKVG